jgi:cytochrome b subunit of formate dehydrogenase
LIVIPWILIQIPSDYFTHERRKKHEWGNYPPIIRLILLLVKNILGVVFIVSGIIMLFIPGQGILTVIIGVILSDFPHKYKIEIWIINQPKILKYINKIRVKAKQRPIEV